MNFYENNQLQKAFDEDKNFQTTRVEPMLDPMTKELMEPSLSFNEFLFLLGLIAYRTITSSESIYEKLQDFYIQKLGFDQPSEQVAMRDLTYDEVLERVYNQGYGSEDEK